MALSVANANFRRVGPGKLFLLPAPTSGITDGADYLALFFTTGTTEYTPSALKTTVKPWANADKSGLAVSMKMAKVKFDPNVGPATEMVTGLDTASADLTIFDLDPAHLVDIFGSQASDLVVTGTGATTRQMALLGPQSWNTLYTALYQMPSSQHPGQYCHYVFPCVSVVSDVTVDLSKSKEMSLKVSFQLQTSPFVNNAAGFGVVCLVDEPTPA